MQLPGLQYLNSIKLEQAAARGAAAALCQQQAAARPDQCQQETAAREAARQHNAILMYNIGRQPFDRITVQPQAADA